MKPAPAGGWLRIILVPFFICLLSASAGAATGNAGIFISLQVTEELAADPGAFLFLPSRWKYPK